MNLEFDFEFHVLHATHKALGLGRRISKGLRPHAADPDASTCNQNIALFPPQIAQMDNLLAQSGPDRAPKRVPKVLILVSLKVPR